MDKDTSSKVLKIKKAIIQDGRFYLQDKILYEKTKFKPGVPYQYIIDQTKKIIEILPAENGTKIVSKRLDSAGNIIKSVIDIRNQEMKDALTGCDYVSVTILEERIIVVGYIRPGNAVERSIEKKNELTSMTFCAGGGISAYFSAEAGFKEIALLEYNPSDRPEHWEKYANIAEENHQAAIIYNLPIEEFSAAMLPDDIDVWMITLPCNDYSMLKRARAEEEGRFPSLHHFLHVVRIFTETPNHKKPACIFFENVPTFAKIAGESLKLFFKDQGYHVSSATLDSADFGSRMHRERWYMCANTKGRFTFPEPTGRQSSPMLNESWFNLNDFEWMNPANSKSISRLLQRQGNKNTFGIKAINPATEAVSYTIPKNYRISVPQGMVKHPTASDTYAVFPPEYLKRLFSLPEQFYTGDSKTTQYEVLGQSVDGTIMRRIYNALYAFLKTPKQYESPSEHAFTATPMVQLPLQF